MTNKRKRARADTTPAIMPNYNADILIGIDCGTNTGIAIYDKRERKLLHAETYKLHEAIFFFENCLKANKELKIIVLVENPNTYRRFSRNNAENKAKLQGAGSVKRDYAIWCDYFDSIKVEYYGVSVIGTAKKLDAETFKKYTGYEKRTSNHARDAAMLVFGR